MYVIMFSVLVSTMGMKTELVTFKGGGGGGEEVVEAEMMDSCCIVYHG